ncbi:MAG: DMT family transporter [Chloroflexi bacterium]|nr:DMT family transporter [Chloroflexota bacterium]
MARGVYHYDMTRKDMALFLALSAIWGSSFLFIKLGLQGGLQPLTLVALRLFFGAGVMFLLAKRLGLPLAAALPFLPHIALLALVNNVLPFSLITWGEKYIDSGMAAILNSTTPLFTAILSHFSLSDERLTWRRILGVSIGFMGVLVLFAPDLLFGTGANRVIGGLAVVAASAGYAFGSVFARKHLTGISATVLTTVQLSLAFVWVLLPALFLEQAWQASPTPLAWFSVMWLGMLGTGLAYLLFFRLLRDIGATPTTMVTYVIPLFAVIFGAVLLNERLHWTQLVAMALIFMGIWLVSAARSRRDSRSA